MRWRNLSSCWFVIANLPFLNEKTSMKDQWWKVLLELQTLVPLCSSQQMYLIVFVFVAMMQHDDYQCNRSSHNRNYCIRYDDHKIGDFVNDNCILASNLKWQQIASLWRVVLRFWKRKPLCTSAHLSFAISKCKDLTQENAYRKFAVREIIVAFSAFTTCIGTYFGIGTLQLQDTVYV